MRHTVVISSNRARFMQYKVSGFIQSLPLSHEYPYVCFPSKI